MSNTIFAGAVLALVVTGAAVAAPAPKTAPAAKPAQPMASGPQAPDVPDFPKMTGAAVAKSLTLLQSSSESFSKQRLCMSCHHQLLTSMAVDWVKPFGFKANEAQAKANNQGIVAELQFVDKLLQDPAGQAKGDAQVDKMLVDPAINAGYVFAGLKASGYPKDEAAGRFALYLGRRQMEDGRWPVIAGRPPQETSDFTATALAVKALKEYGPADKSEEVSSRLIKAREWLTRTPAKSAEDRAFRLMGLAWAGAGHETLRTTIETIFENQQDDGGWAQLPNMGTDAYATGLTLTALQTAGVTPADHRYLKGGIYLVLRQREDGSWQVTSRSQPAQPYFETGFPHRKDQFISAAATAWAVMALSPMGEPPSATVASRK